MDKKTLRQDIYRYLNDLPSDEMRRKSRELSEKISAQPLWKRCEQILIFLSFGKELETEFLIKQAWKEGKKVAVPRLYGKEMEFHYLDSPDDRLEINRMGIREPLAASPRWDQMNGATLMLTPGLAFGTGGERLGRGGGFYDRYLSRHDIKLTTTGICFEYQVKEGIPSEDHDKKVDSLCTEKRFIAISPEKESY